MTSIGHPLLSKPQQSVYKSTQQHCIVAASFLSLWQLGSWVIWKSLEGMIPNVTDTAT